ncbi:MAG: hypothetical protein IT376_02040 [Polyangiaceae bacterium]|nr:hypothetical protein [Polyangiaceae bacterium]
MSTSSPAPRAAEPPEPAGAGARPPRGLPLRLAVARGRLGIELHAPVELGPVEVSELVTSLVGLRFPVDLSGGVRTFRHRRGELSRLELRASLARLGAYLEPRLREVLREPVRPPTLWGVEGGLAVGLVGRTAVLAFELLWVADPVDLKLVVANARGAGLGGPALGHALRAVDAAFGPVAARAGRTVTLAGPARAVARLVLPDIGMRAPSAAAARLASASVEGDELRIGFDADAPMPPAGGEATRHLELAGLVVAADDALAAGERDAARAGYLAALERAPRHPELARLVAELDVAAGGRAEAALGLLAEATPALHGGLIAAELLASTGDLDGAREAAAAAARLERFAPAAAGIFVRLAELEAEPAAALRALDQAVALAPALEQARRRRLGCRLAIGDVDDALSDAAMLEAAASGARARHEVCASVGAQLIEAGFVREAGRVFERALRYVPDDVDATTGLARSLLATGRAERGLALLERAVALAEARGVRSSRALVELARVLAERLGDLPQAIARVREVPAGAAEAADARGLEARWRAAVGDVEGASLAWARLRELVETGRVALEAGALLLDAGRYELERGDVRAAERHLAVALRARPRDPAIAAAYRDAAGRVSAAAAAHDPTP